VTGLNSNKYAEKSILELFSFVPTLKTILKDAAPKFLKLGQTLESIYSEANNITQLTLEIVQTTGDKSDQNLLNNVAALSRQSLKQLEKSSVDISANLEKVETSTEYLDRLYKSLHILRRISKTLGIVSLNIAIESNRSGKSKDTFSFFVDEINALSNRVNVISREINNDSKTSKIKQQDIWTHVIDRGKQLQKITATADDMIEGNIDKIKQLFETSRDKLEKSTFHSKEISRHIGEIIESIQFEDITRQQIEHIIEAVQDIEEKYNKELYLEDDQSMDPEILAQIFSLINIQAAQIEQVISEIREAHNKILNAFNEIGDLIDLLVGITTTDFSSKKQIQNETGVSFEELISDFTNLDMVLEQGHNLSDKIEEAMLKSTEIALQLSSHINKIEDISLDLHIKAINAIIMSNQLGSEGITLSVLAKTVTDVSKESNDYVTEVVEIINSISKLTEDLNKTPKNEKIKGKSTGDNKKYLLAPTLKEVSSTYKKFQEDSTLTFKYSTSLKDTLVLVKSELPFLLEMAVQLETCLDNINLTVQSLESHIEQSYLNEMNLNHISGKYTMKVERDIHNKAIEKTSLAPLNTNKTINDSYDDFGDNVELF
ncbi:MAG: hypothetical protein PVG39_21400, partial [Desulfobacteraceae bacterium]